MPLSTKNSTSGGGLKKSHSLFPSKLRDNSVGLQSNDSFISKEDSLDKEQASLTMKVNGIPHKKNLFGKPNAPLSKPPLSKPMIRTDS